MKKPELLSPAGNMKCLKAAIQAGCDAVYIGGKHFGARNYAGNFTDEEIIEAINYSHLYGVKVYVTVNTLIYDSEVNSFLNYIDFLHKNSVDAVIMQDLGMIDLVHKTYPNLEIHASTQAHIHNLEGVKLCEEMGLKRVVLARETPINLIKEIKENSNIELEIFIHGALCISYSGQCLMSSLIGGRSGNRGTCAQCCRQPYDLIVNNKKINKDKYLLSTKDLNTLENIDKLIDIGVDSLKIEGRMKREEYVYLVTSIYRRAIDSYVETKKVNITESDIKQLKKIFNREFTKGFIFNEDNNSFTNPYRPNHMGIEIGKVVSVKNNLITIELIDELNIGDGIRIIDKKDIGFNVEKIISKNKNRVVLYCKDKINVGSKVVKTTDKEQLQNINNLINSNKRKVLINGRLKLKVGNKAYLEISDNKNKVIIEGNIVENSINSPISKERIEEQITKLGSTVYKFNNLEIDMDDNIFISIKELNELRRRATEELNNKRLYNIEYKKSKYYIDLPDFKKEQNKNILIDNIKYYNDNYDYIYTEDINLFNKIDNNKKILKLNRVNEYLKDYNCNLLVGELGSVYKYKNVSTDYSLNVTNSYTVAYLHSIGVKRITLSYELNYNQIKKLINNYHERYNKHPNLEVIIDSYPEVMISKYKLIKSNSGYLVDRFNNKYKIKIKNNLMHIYNYKKIKLEENYFEIGINNIRIHKEDINV